MHPKKKRRKKPTSLLQSPLPQHAARHPARRAHEQPILILLRFPIFIQHRPPGRHGLPAVIRRIGVRGLDLARRGVLIGPLRRVGIPDRCPARGHGGREVVVIVVVLQRLLLL